MALPLALVLALTCQTAPFVPALQHGSKSVPQWIEELTHGSRTLDAVWSLYYADEHTPQVIAALQDALAETHNPECRMAADTILCQWNVPHALLPAEVYSGGIALSRFVRGLAAPIDALEGTPDSREAALRSPDEHRRAAAALGMLSRREQVDRALDCLLECGKPEMQADPPTRNLLEPVDGYELSEWASKHLGSAYFAALGRRLAEHRTPLRSFAAHPELCAWLTLETPGASAALPWLEQLAASDPKSREALAPALSRLLDRELEWYGTNPWHRGLRRRAPAVEADPFLEAHYLERARALLARSPSSYAEMLQLHACALEFPAVAQFCRQNLPPLAEREDEIGTEATCILGSLGSVDPRARTSYLRVLRTWNQFDDGSLDRLPSWKVHDPETRAAFLQLMRRIGNPSALLEHIWLAGERDASTSEIARELIDRTQGGCAWLVSRGFRGSVAVDPRASLATQVNQLALNIATKQSNRLDFSEEEKQLVEILERPYTEKGAGGYFDQVQWGLFHAQTLGLHSPRMLRVALHYVEIGDTMEGFSTHAEAALPYLESVPLGIEEHLALRRLRGEDEAESEWHGVNIANTRFGGEPVSMLSLEDVPRWRHRVFTGESQFFGKLLRVTPLTEREEPYLTALLEQGSVEQRLWSLDLVEDLKLDTPAIRACVSRLAERDLDDSVRRAALHRPAVRATPR